MALKGERQIDRWDLSLICNDIVSAGAVGVYKTAGSGAAFGDSAGVVTVSASSSGKIPCGIFVLPFNSVDQTKFHRNFHNLEQMLGEPASLAKTGWLVTDQTVGTPTQGATAYLSSSGKVTPTVDPNGGTVATPKVGQYDSIKDADGYVKLSFNLPVV